jgi:hypothetical protein
MDNFISLADRYAILHKCEVSHKKRNSDRRPKRLSASFWHMGPMELFFELQKNSNLKVSKNS